MRIRLSQPPAGNWLAGAWSELGKKIDAIYQARIISSCGAAALFPLSHRFPLSLVVTHKQLMNKSQTKCQQVLHEQVMS